MPTQFDHFVPADLRAALRSADPQILAEAQRKLVSNYNKGRRKDLVSLPPNHADLVNYSDRLLGLHWGTTRCTQALRVLLIRHAFSPPPTCSAAPTHLPDGEVGKVYDGMNVEQLELIWEVSRDSAALDALWRLEGFFNRVPVPDSVLAFRWWHEKDSESLDHLLRRLQLRPFVVPDLVERCATPDNQSRLLELYGQIAVPPGSTAADYAADVVFVLIEGIGTYWNLRRFRSVQKALKGWVSSRSTDKARRGRLQQAALRGLAAPTRRRNREALPDRPNAQPIGRAVGRTVSDIIRLTALVRTRAALGDPGWSDGELDELAHMNLRWVKLDNPSAELLREAREVIAEDTAGWALSAQPNDDEIRNVFGWYPEFGPRVAEQVVLRDELTAALNAALPGRAGGKEVANLRDDVLRRIRLAIDWVRDQRTYLKRPVPEFAALLAAAQELWWAVAQADANCERDAELQDCRGLFELFCRRFRAARQLAPCYLIAAKLSDGGQGVPSAVRGHPALVDWLERGLWRDNFELRQSRKTPYRAEDVRKGVVERLESSSKIGSPSVRSARLLLLAWLRAVPAAADFADETAALDTVYWSQIDSGNTARWRLLGSNRPGTNAGEWPHLDGIRLEEMVEAASKGEWLRVADLAAEASFKMKSAGGSRWSPAVELEGAVRFLKGIQRERRQALRRCRELFGELPEGVRMRLQSLGERLKDDTLLASPSALKGVNWKDELSKPAESADVQLALNMLSLWLSTYMQPEGKSLHRLADLDTLWAAVAQHKSGQWHALAGRVPDIIANAARANWRVVARLASNALADVPDGSGPRATVFAALERLADGGGRAFAPGGGKGGP